MNPFSAAIALQCSDPGVLVAIYVYDAETDGAVKGKVDPRGGILSLAEMGLRDHEARILEFIVQNKRPLFRGRIRNATKEVSLFSMSLVMIIASRS